MGSLYSGLKIFHFKEKIDSLLAENGEIRPPVHMRIKPTNVCNHRCRYCAYRVQNLQLGQDMNKVDSIPRQKMLEIIEDLVDMGVEAVTFSGGGEPFCYPHLLEAAEKLAESPIRFSCLSNGALLKGAVAEVFAHHATWIRISMDGWDAESYASYRGVSPGEFAKVTGNMAAFKKLGGTCYLGVSLIVDQHNAGHVYEFVEKMKDLGVDSVKVSPCIVSNVGTENNAYHYPVFKRVKEEVERAVSAFASEEFEIFDAYHELDDKFAKDYCWCPYLQILAVVGADLNVYPCQDKAYNLAEGLLGSIKERRFKDFWLGGRETFFRIDPSLHCNHHCVANTKNRLVLEYLGTDRNHRCFV